MLSNFEFYGLVNLRFQFFFCFDNSERFYALLLAAVLLTSSDTIIEQKKSLYNIKIIILLNGSCFKVLLQ